MDEHKVAEMSSEVQNQLPSTQHVRKPHASSCANWNHGFSSSKGLDTEQPEQTASLTRDKCMVFKCSVITE